MPEDSNVQLHRSESPKSRDQFCSDCSEERAASIFMITEFEGGNYSMFGDSHPAMSVHSQLTVSALSVHCQFTVSS